MEQLENKADNEKGIDLELSKFDKGFRMVYGGVCLGCLGFMYIHTQHPEHIETLKNYFSNLF